MLRILCSLLILQIIASESYVESATLQSSEDKNSKSSLSSIFVDDVVVESTLSVRRKPGNRQGRTGPGVLQTNNAPKQIDGSTVLQLRRPKRQHRRRPQFGHPGQFGQYPQFPQFQPLSGSASNAQAQAQGFQSNGPLGGFGASAANAGSQGFSFGPNGFNGNAGLSGSQSYNLPNGNTLAISYANGFSVGPDGRPTITRGNSIAYSGSDGKPVPGFAYNPTE